MINYSDFQSKYSSGDMGLSLTDRQRVIYDFLKEGYSVKRVASEMGVSKGAVYYHITKIRIKMHEARHGRVSNKVICRQSKETQHLILNKSRKMQEELNADFARQQIEVRHKSCVRKCNKLGEKASRKLTILERLRVLFTGKME